jgi:hypothetical protein
MSLTESDTDALAMPIEVHGVIPIQLRDPLYFEFGVDLRIPHMGMPLPLNPEQFAWIEGILARAEVKELKGCCGLRRQYRLIEVNLCGGTNGGGGKLAPQKIRDRLRRRDFWRTIRTQRSQ